MNWIQIIFFALAVLVIITNIQVLIAYRRNTIPVTARKFTFKKWSFVFSSLLALLVMYSAI
jgi:hypothetical protein